MSGDIALAFRDASDFFVNSVRLVPDGHWESPGLGDWSVRELVAHGNRAHTTVARYLLEPQEPQAPGSSYFGDEAIAARDRETVVALGNDPVRAVEAATTAIALIVQSSPERTISGPARAMMLAQYLPSRTAELTAHGLDIVLVGAQLTAPATAVEASLAFVARLAARRNTGQQLLLAAVGRSPLPTGYSVY